MRRLWIVAMLAAIAATGTASAQKAPVDARITIVIACYETSNDILFGYARLLDFEGLKSLANAHPSDLIPFTDLIAKLPGPLDGWTGATPQGAQISLWGGIYTFGGREYKKSGAGDRVTLMIYDTMNQQVGPWYDFWQLWGYEFHSSDGYGVPATVAGYPAWETRNQTRNLGVLFMGVGIATSVPEADDIWSVGAGLLSLVLLGRFLRSTICRGFPAPSA